MNIKRMADQYRRQVSSTGQGCRMQLESVAEDLTWDHRVASARAYLRLMYRSLEKALGRSRGLEELEKSWQKLVQMSKIHHRLHRKSPVGNDLEHLGKLHREASEHLERFLKKLPGLIEESLRRSVRESGIKF